jgi:hypothetical protein
MAGNAHIAVDTSADAMMVFVSFVTLRLSQKSARAGSEQNNVVEIVVAFENAGAPRDPPYRGRIFTPGAPS